VDDVHKPPRISTEKLQQYQIYRAIELRTQAAMLKTTQELINLPASVNANF
jgi:hypothetical protein